MALAFAFVCCFESGRIEAAGGADVGGGIEIAAELNRYGQAVLGGRFVDAGGAGQRFLRVVLFGDGVDLGERKPERFADVANRRARAVGDDLRGHCSVFATVPFVDVLDDLLAVLVCEIDVDVGDFVALLGEKALEEQIHADRIDGGDAQRVADR
jgi:hypothetical protein